MKNIIKNNYKLFIGILIGVVITATSVFAATNIASSSVTYNNSSSGLNANNVKTAIDILYQQMNTSAIKSYPSCSSGEGNNSCTITNMVVGKYYFCAINNRGDLKATVNNAEVLYNWNNQSFLDGRYTSNLIYLKANSTSVVFTVSGTSGMSAQCYNIVNVK